MDTNGLHDLMDNRSSDKMRDSELKTEQKTKPERGQNPDHSPHGYPL
jgi:hypothetical protein